MSSKRVTRSEAKKAQEPEAMDTVPDTLPLLGDSSAPVKPKSASKSKKRKSTAKGNGKPKKLKESCPECGKVRDGETIFVSKNHSTGVCAQCFESEHKSDESPRKAQKCDKCGELTSVPIMQSVIPSRVLCPTCVGGEPQEECPVCLKNFDPAKHPVKCKTGCCQRRMCTTCAIMPTLPCRKCSPGPISKPKSKVVWCTKCKNNGACTCPSQPDSCIECKGPADSEGDECYYCQEPWCENCQDQTQSGPNDAPKCPKCTKKSQPVKGKPVCMQCKGASTVSKCFHCGAPWCQFCQKDELDSHPECPQCVNCDAGNCVDPGCPNYPKKSYQPLPSRWCKCGAVLSDSDGLYCPKCRPEAPQKRSNSTDSKPPSFRYCKRCDVLCNSCGLYCNTCAVVMECKEPMVVEGRTPLLRSIKRDEAGGKEGKKVAPIEDDAFLSSKPEGCIKCGHSTCLYEDDPCPLCDVCFGIDCHCDECEVCCDCEEDGPSKKPEKSARMRTMKPDDRKKLDERIHKAQDLVTEMATLAPKIRTEYGLEQMAKMAQRVLDACNKKK